MREISGEPKKLVRRLTRRQVSMIGLSGALGTGLFLGSGSVIALAGPATILAYLIAGLFALAVVWALAEMVSVHPVAGGHGTVAAAYLGRRGGYVARWNFAVQSLVATGAEVTATATYIQFWFPAMPLWVGTIGCAVVIFAFNTFSVRLYGSSEYWFSMIKIVAAVAFILLGIALIIGAVPGQDPIGMSHFTDDGGFFARGMLGLLAASAMAVFSFGGIENVSSTAAESENPSRDIPHAASAMIWRIIIFYIAGIAVVLALQPWSATAAQGNVLTESPFVRALELTGISAAAHIMNAVLIVAALSSANGCLYAATRMIHALSIDGEAPAFARNLNAAGAPIGAIGISAIAVAATATLSITAPEGAFAYLIGATIVAILITWTIIMATHLAFRRARREAGLGLVKRRLWGAPVVNYVVIVACVANFVALHWLMPLTWWAGIPYIVILLGSDEILRRTRTLPAPVDLLSQSLAAADKSDTADVVVSGDAER
ncbi:amino acid permease [Arcanobacterium canis]|uniref:Amino acid permease n=1 Tax=Arcanobacterium canis TaxID=999183 RepID=A0ABY8G0W5_9ACTO|nr:amino acid permease [Arcanobacterium canis]WFM83705.1 amino acid permease [Arcanobacterium canis]